MQHKHFVWRCHKLSEPFMAMHRALPGLISCVLLYGISPVLAEDTVIEIPVLSMDMVYGANTKSAFAQDALSLDNLPHSSEQAPQIGKQELSSQMNIDPAVLIEQSALYERRMREAIQQQKAAEQEILRRQRLATQRAYQAQLEQLQREQMQQALPVQQFSPARIAQQMPNQRGASTLRSQQAQYSQYAQSQYAQSQYSQSQYFQRSQRSQLTQQAQQALAAQSYTHPREIALTEPVVIPDLSKLKLDEGVQTIVVLDPTLADLTTGFSASPDVAKAIAAAEVKLQQQQNQSQTPSAAAIAADFAQSESEQYIANADFEVNHESAERKKQAQAKAYVRHQVANHAKYLAMVKNSYAQRTSANQQYAQNTSASIEEPTSSKYYGIKSNYRTVMAQSQVNRAPLNLVRGMGQNLASAASSAYAMRSFNDAPNLRWSPYFGTQTNPLRVQRVLGSPSQMAPSIAGAQNSMAMATANESTSASPALQQLQSWTAQDYAFDTPGSRNSKYQPSLAAVPSVAALISGSQASSNSLAWDRMLQAVNYHAMAKTASNPNGNPHFSRVSPSKGNGTVAVASVSLPSVSSKDDAALIANNVEHTISYAAMPMDDGLDLADSTGTSLTTVSSTTSLTTTTITTATTTTVLSPVSVVVGSAMGSDLATATADTASDATSLDLSSYAGTSSLSSSVASATTIGDTADALAAIDTSTTGATVSVLNAGTSVAEGLADSTTTSTDIAANTADDSSALTTDGSGTTGTSVTDSDLSGDLTASTEVSTTTESLLGSSDGDSDSDGSDDLLATSETVVSADKSVLKDVTTSPSGSGALVSVEQNSSAKDPNSVDGEASDETGSSTEGDSEDTLADNGDDEVTNGLKGEDDKQDDVADGETVTDGTLANNESTDGNESSTVLETPNEETPPSSEVEVMSQTLEKASRLGIYGGGAQAALMAGQSTVDLVYSRMGIRGLPNTIQPYTAEPTKNNAWAVSPYGLQVWVSPVYRHQDSSALQVNNSSYGANLNLYGLALGTDYSLESGVRFGAALNIGEGEASGKGIGNGVTNDFDYYSFALYGGLTYKQFSIVTDITYAKVNNQFDAFADFTHITASMDSTDLSIGVTGQYVFTLKNEFSMAPHVGFRYSQVELKDYKLSSLSDNISYDLQGLNYASFPIGVTFAKTWQNDGWYVTPALDLTAIFNVGDTAIKGDIIWDNTRRNRFGVSSEVIDNVSYSATLGLTAGTSRLNLGVSFNYTGSANIYEYSANASVRWLF